MTLQRYKSNGHYSDGPCDNGEWVRASEAEALKQENKKLREIVAAKGARCPTCDKWERAREYLGLPWKQYNEALKKIFEETPE